MLQGRPQEKNTELFGNFSQHRGGGLLIPKTFVILTIALKKPLKHLKITQKFPTWPKKIGKKWSKFPKGGGGGGVRHLGKTPKKSRIFFLTGSLTWLPETMKSGNMTENTQPAMTWGKQNRQSYDGSIPAPDSPGDWWWLQVEGQIQGNMASLFLCNRGVGAVQSPWQDCIDEKNEIMDCE